MFAAGITDGDSRPSKDNQQAVFFEGVKGRKHDHLTLSIEGEEIQQMEAMYGYNTVIGENGEKLSGGERQRISIARAFLKDAPVILLDEATASLDAENETLIQQSISRLIKNKTVMIIAHRMRTVAGADKIVVIKDGRADEQGAPEELEKQNGIYAKMLALQK